MHTHADEGRAIDAGSTSYIHEQTHSDHAEAEQYKQRAPRGKPHRNASAARRAFPGGFRGLEASCGSATWCRRKCTRHPSSHRNWVRESWIDVCCIAAKKTDTWVDSVRSGSGVCACRRDQMVAMDTDNYVYDTSVRTVRSIRLVQMSSTQLAKTYVHAHIHVRHVHGRTHGGTAVRSPSHT